MFLQVSVILFTGGVPGRGGSAPREGLLQGEGGAWSGGCLVRGSAAEGGCLVGGVPGGDPPGRLLLRAVRILLECILVVNAFDCGINFDRHNKRPLTSCPKLHHLLRIHVKYSVLMNYFHSYCF